jgi:hypothetical protein
MNGQAQTGGGLRQGAVETGGLGTPEVGAA